MTATTDVDHEVERMARLMHRAFTDLVQADGAATNARGQTFRRGDGVARFEELDAGTRRAYRHVARVVIDDPGRRM